MIFFIPLYFCFYFQKLENISPIHFTSIKWKKSKWFAILPNGKKYQIEKLENTFISTKWKKWSNFLCFSTYLTLFPQSGKHFIVAVYFHKIQKKLSNFLDFFIHISFHFHEVDYISPMRFISTKWKIFHQRTVFLWSGSILNELHYCQIVKNDRDRSRNICLSVRSWKKLNDFIYFFTHCFHLHEVENIHQYVFTKKYLLIYTTSKKLKLFKRETRDCE